MIHPGIEEAERMELEELTWSFEEEGAEHLPRILAHYERWGCLIARGLVPPAALEDIRVELRRLIELMLMQAGLENLSGPEAPFDAELARLYAHAPPLAENVFTAARRLTSMHALSVHPRLLALSRALMKTDMIMSSPYKPVRMDNPAREHMLLPWHQDYPYAQDSVDGVVYWIPLQDVNPQNGCLRVAPGSHRLGPLPVVMMLPPASHPAGIKGLRLADEALPEQLESLEVPMKAGDVLVFSNLLLHRSQQNHTPRARWTVQIRHGNFAHPHAISKLWPRGHYERHWFDETHPELVEGVEEPAS